MDNRGLLQDKDNKLRRARQLETGGTKRISEYNRDLKTEEMNHRQLTVNCHVAFNTKCLIAVYACGRPLQLCTVPIQWCKERHCPRTNID